MNIVSQSKKNLIFMLDLPHHQNRHFSNNFKVKKISFNKLAFLSIIKKNTSMKLGTITQSILFKTLFGVAFLLMSTVHMTAQVQDSCSFRLRCFDSQGNGWNGSQVFIRTGSGFERAFTHGGTIINVSDSTRNFIVRVKTGDSLWIRYDGQGFNQNEVQYTLFDNTGSVVFNAGPSPVTGLVFRGIAKCVTCGPALNVKISDIRTTNATASWQPAQQGFQATYLVEWDTTNFRYGTGRNRLRTTDTFAILSGLTEFVKYDAYIRTVCFGTDSSTVTNRVTFLTDTATDLSVIRILSPTGSCSLGVDSIQILLKNIGGVPQQLFYYNVSINGVKLLPTPPPLPTAPLDGLYTGVLSKDSTAKVTFKTLYDFSQPGEYDIRAWTDVAGDKNRKNDTARLVVTKVRTIATFPYYQNFELGKDTWSVYDSLGTSTWEYGTPKGAAFKSAASGTKAWTTWKDTTYRNNEWGYLLSPCLDFSSLNSDPRINLFVNVNSEPGYDGSWLEATTDGGLSWKLIGQRRTGINWYNDSITEIRQPTWGGAVDSVKTWRLAQNVLTGTANKPSVRLRIAFRSDLSGNNYDGVAFDDISISAVPTQDLAMASQNFTLASAVSCGDSVINTLTVPIVNLGTTAQRTFNVSYQINGGAVVTEILDTLMSVGQILRYKITKPFKTVTAGDYTIKVWVNLAGDQQRLNDTITSINRINLEKPLLVNTYPYFQDFESGTGTWTAVDSLNGTWGYGTPNNNTFINTAASGTKMFKTGSTSPTGTYNNAEWNFVLSPCFDFSSLTADPRISFSLNFHTERTYDGSWLEGSTNGGASWTRIGTRNTGVNWYNDSISGVQRGAWSGVTLVGWKTAQNTLTGFAGKPNCRFRFAFRSDGSGNSTGGIPNGGVAIDNIFIGATTTVDLAAGAAQRLDISDCGRATDSISMNITNAGTTRQYRFNASYSVDNGPTVTELIDSTLNILPGQTASYKFRTPFSSLIGGNHSIKTWVKAVGDTTLVNDTLTTSYFIPLPIGNLASYNFDNGVLPQYWRTTGTTVVGVGAHGNVSTNGNIYANIWSSNKAVEIITHRFGTIRSKDSLSFDYRFINELSPYAAYPTNTNDTLYVQGAFDCETTYTNIMVITAANHVQSANYQTIKVPLAAFVYRTVRLRFRVGSAITLTTGYWVDIDNVNFISCPENFAVQSTVRNSRQGASVGAIIATPTQGLAPFTYNWSNGRTTDSIVGLSAGTYQLTITDGRGCTQTASFTVVNTVGTFDVSSIFSKITLAPNPTTDIASLNIELSRPAAARVQVLNIMGQLLYETQSAGTIQQQTFDIDLSNRPSGVYLVRIMADNRSYVARLVKQ